MGVSCKLSRLDRQGLHWLEGHSDAIQEFLVLLVRQPFSEKQLSKVPTAIRVGLATMDSDRDVAREHLRRRGAPSSVLNGGQGELLSLGKDWQVLFRAIEISGSCPPVEGVVEKAYNDSIRLWSEREVLEVKDGMAMVERSEWEDYLKEASLRENWEFGSDQDMVGSIRNFRDFLEEAATHNEGIAVCFL